MTSADSDPESHCHRCGGPNVSWFAPSPEWNEVMRNGDIDGAWQFNEIICPTCFCILAKDNGLATSFRVSAVELLKPVQMVTPSGRRYSYEQDLWIEAGND